MANISNSHLQNGIVIIGKPQERIQKGFIPLINQITRKNNSLFGFATDINGNLTSAIKQFKYPNQIDWNIETCKQTITEIRQITDKLNKIKNDYLNKQQYSFAWIIEKVQYNWIKGYNTTKITQDSLKEFRLPQPKNDQPQSAIETQIAQDIQKLLDYATNLQKQAENTLPFKIEKDDNNFNITIQPIKHDKTITYNPLDTTESPQELAERLINPQSGNTYNQTLTSTQTAKAALASFISIARWTNQNRNFGISINKIRHMAIDQEYLKEQLTIARNDATKTKDHALHAQLAQLLYSAQWIENLWLHNQHKSIAGEIINGNLAELSRQEIQPLIKPTQRNAVNRILEDAILVTHTSKTNDGSIIPNKLLQDDLCLEATKKAKEPLLCVDNAETLWNPQNQTRGSSLKILGINNAEEGKQIPSIANTIKEMLYYAGAIIDLNNNTVDLK